MKINSINSNSLSFQKVFVSDKNMTPRGKHKMNQFVSAFEYDTDVIKLDRMGVDVVILPADYDDGEGARVYLADSTNRVYKVNDEDYSVDTGAFSSFNREYNPKFHKNMTTGVHRIFDVIDNVLRGKLTDKSMLPNPQVNRVLANRTTDETTFRQSVN